MPDRAQDSAERRSLAARGAGKVARVLLAAYVLAALLTMGFADRMIFVPPPPSYGPTDDVLRLQAADGAPVAARLLPAAGAEVTVLFAHGNAEDLGGVTSLAERLTELGVSVMLFDYPGYGASPGSPSEEGAYAAADAAYRHLTEELGIAPRAIVAHGRSLGGGVMADLASRAPVGGLVLESTFVSAYRVVTRARLLPFDQFETLRKLPRVTAPVLVIHGEDDEVIPPWHGRTLFEALPEDRRSSLWVPGAHHNDLERVAGADYFRALGDFLDRVAEAAREG